MGEAIGLTVYDKTFKVTEHNCIVVRGAREEIWILDEMGCKSGTPSMQPLRRFQCCK